MTVEVFYKTISELQYLYLCSYVAVRDKEKVTH